MTQLAIESSVLEAFHRREIAVPDGPIARRPVPSGAAVRIEGLRKRFGDQDVLRGISLDVRAGEFIAIVGRSGGGKSTLLRLMAGLAEPSGGAIGIGGEPVSGRFPDARIMFQDARLLPWRRVLDNVGIGLRGGWRPEAHLALRSVGLEQRAYDWPAVLSGGQRQRVALARALVSRPRLLLLDEPLGALDALTRLEMQALIENVWRAQGFTAVLVTHDVAEAVALADRVILLDRGVISLDVKVPHSRPRQRGNTELSALEATLLDRLMKEGRRHFDTPVPANQRIREVVAG
jgi:sulfonate transport system ATP-binding protein